MPGSSFRYKKKVYKVGERFMVMKDRQSIPAYKSGFTHTLIVEPGITGQFMCFIHVTSKGRKNSILDNTYKLIVVQWDRQQWKTSKSKHKKGKKKAQQRTVLEPFETVITVSELKNIAVQK